MQNISMVLLVFLVYSVKPSSKVTFRTREGDEVETDGGCAIGGQWVNKTTEELFHLEQAKS